MGRHITIELLNDKLLNAHQRQRQAAAMELALIDADMTLQNIRTKMVS